MTAEELGKVVTAEAGAELTGALNRIKHCLNQLSDAQIWSRPAPDLNSIGNLILHLCGNVRQWIVSGLGGATDTRNRPAEFAERGPIARAELLYRLDAVIDEAIAVLTHLKPVELVRSRRVQGFQVTGLGAIFDSIPHFRGHTQEIVHMTRMLLGASYRFAWVPSTPGAEQAT